MEIRFDSKERIARSNIYSLFGRFFRRCTNNNGDGELMLKKAGLSSLVDEYASGLNPYWYNRGYRNDNDTYNPEYVCVSICEGIEYSEEALLRFFNAILESIHSIELDEYGKLDNYLGVIGYELVDYGDYYSYSLLPSSDGLQERNDDISFLRQMLITHHSDLLPLYDEATVNFGNAQYVSCIENSRS